MEQREATNVIRLKRITLKGLTQIFCPTAAKHDVLKDSLTILF